MAQSRYRDDVIEILGEPNDATAIGIGRKLLTRRTISACVGATGRVIGVAADADARPVWARVLGRRLPDSGAAARVLSESQAIAYLTTGFVATRAVVVRNSLRTGLGLAVAVAVTHLFPVQHGFWVVLGAMSVLRSSALTTGTRVLRAVDGHRRSASCSGAIFIELMGVDPAVMWTMLPIVAFGSAYVPEVASFIAGQAMFTMMVLIIFNVIVPTGWSVGLIRVEDVLVGALVGVVVSVLLWPRGASSAVSKAIDAAAAVGATYLQAAVRRVNRGASEAANDRVFALGHDAMTAARTLDDAVRQYLSESGGSTDLRAPVIRAANRATRLRTAAELIADVVPPPLAAYPAGATGAEHPRRHDLRAPRERWSTPPSTDRSATTSCWRCAPRRAVTRSRCRPPCRWSPSRRTSANSSCSTPSRRGPSPAAPNGRAVCGISALGGMTPNLPALKSSMRLDELRLGVHHERPVVEDGLANGLCRRGSAPPSRDGWSPGRPRRPPRCDRRGRTPPTGPGGSDGRPGRPCPGRTARRRGR